MQTPEGSIISMMYKELKPESDPEWEAHKRAHKRARTEAIWMRMRPLTCEGFVKHRCPESCLCAPA